MLGDRPVTTRALDGVAVRGRSDPRDGASSTRRPVPAPGAPLRDDPARDAGLLLPGAHPGHALHLLARRHPERRAISATSTTSTRRTWRCRSSSSTRAGATSPRTRRRWCASSTPTPARGGACGCATCARRPPGRCSSAWRLRIEAIASYSGLKGIFKLLAADIYEVLSVEPVPGRRAPRPPPKPRAAPGADPLFTMQALQDLSTRIHQADSLECLLDSILEGLEDIFGFSHSMILLTGDEPRVLVTVASRGYPESGVGAEVRFGEGHHRPGRRGAEADPHLRADARDAVRHAVRQRAQEHGWCPDSRRRIPLPGLAASRQPARGAAARARRAGRRAVHRERAAVPVPRRGQGRRSSCSAATWRSRSRTCSCRSASDGGAAASSGRPALAAAAPTAAGAAPTAGARES